MKYYIHILTATLLSSSFICSEEEPETSIQTESQQHRVYIGPDIFIDHSKVTYELIGYKETITSNTVYEGIKIGYDYLKPQAFYFGTDGLISIGRSWVKDRSYKFGTFTHKQSPLFANIEQRYGYTFQNPLSKKSTLTPFAALGWYYTKPQFNENFSYANWFYSAIGFRAAHQFCEYFNTGINFKGMYTFAGRLHLDMTKLNALDQSLAPIKENIKDIWGYEIALPFAWLVGTSKRWDVQFQPYFLKIDTDANGQILGAELLAGYSF